MFGQQWPGVRYLGAQGAPLLPDPAYGAGRPAGWVLETAGVRRLGPSTGEGVYVKHWCILWVCSKQKGNNYGVPLQRSLWTQMMVEA